MKTGTWYRAGEVVGSAAIEVSPKNGENFELEELQGTVGGTIDLVNLPSGKVMVVNDEGRINGMPLNREATEIWQKEFPIEEYPNNNAGDIFGSVVVCDSDMVK